MLNQNEDSEVLKSTVILNSLVQSTLIELLHKNKADLFALTHQEFIQLMQKLIPESLYMKGKAKVSAEGHMEVKPHKDFLGLTEDEEIRAFSGLLRFKEVINGTQEDYNSFVACQIEMKKPVLSFESFIAMRKYVLKTLETPEDYAAAMWSILCNDLGKVHTVIEAYQKVPNKKNIGHDGLLAELLKENPELFPAFMSLTFEHQQQIIAGYASGCDVSMYEQFELPIVSLEALKKLDPKALKMYILHTIFDVSGAAAHFKPNGSLTMHQETWNFFEATRKSLERLHESQYNSIEEAYGSYLQYRGTCIGIENDSPEAMALIRIAGLSRLATPAQGKMLLSVWEQLPTAIKATLIRELNVHGGKEQRAIFIGYGVAMLMNPQGALQKELSEAAKISGAIVTPEQRAAATKEGLSIGLTIMAKAFAKSRATIGQDAERGLYVAECDELARSLNINPRKALTLDLATAEKSNRRIDFKFENRPGTACSRNPNAWFKTAAVAVVAGACVSIVAKRFSSL